MSAGSRVLVVDDERDMAETCAWFLRRAGHIVTTANSGEDALRELQHGRFDLVVTDLRMPRMSGLQLLAEIKRRAPDLEVLLLTGFPEIETAVAAIKQGAFDYVRKPYAEDDLMQRVAKALAHGRVKAGNASLRERLQAGPVARQLRFASAAFGHAVATLERAARSDASVLLQGESGTGKELLAHHLHDSSERHGRPFVPVDCTAIPENLVESELFGHVKGSFTGADSNKMGLFQVADGGTLFLDEVGELPAAFQPKLLRAIQERQVRPVGAANPVAVDVRIVCATNRNLQREVDEGRFRADLFYRIDVVRIEVPPLRERREDIELLSRAYVERFGARHGIVEIPPDVMELLLAYHWPGNVRQLRNAIERACTLGQAPALRRDDLPAELRAEAEVAVEPLALGENLGTFQEMKARRIAAMESAYVQGLLKKHKGNVTHCAEEAGMSRSAFQKLMQRYTIRSSDFRG